MTRFLLDTNMASALIRGQANVVHRVKATAPERLCLSVVTEAELLFGVAKRLEARRLRVLIDELLAAVDILPWTSATARRYASLRADLEQRGKPFGALDTMIAAHAIEHDAVLVTSDQAFADVAGLPVEDWTRG